MRTSNSTKSNALLCSFIIVCSLLTILNNPCCADSGKLMGGTSKINITPKTEEPIHDSVYARSLVLDLNGKRIAFVSVDLVIFTSDRIETLCRKQYGIDRVFLCSY